MKRMLNRQILFTAALILLCSSCAFFPKAERGAPDGIPEAYRAGTPADALPLTNEWWRAFGDEQLNGIMARALGGNLSIEQAAARLRQAEASAVKAGAARFPEIGGSAKAGSEYRHTQNQRTVTTDSFELRLAASYEIDLWGRVASSRRAALYELESSRYNLEAAAMTIAAETAARYFEWQQLSRQLEVLRQQLKTNRQMLSVVEKRFETSDSSALNVLQQRRQTLAVRAALSPVKAALAATANELAILTGAPPQTELNLKPVPMPALPPAPDAGVPAELLARRPDLQSKWALLEAADYTVRAARADRLPALTLTGAAWYGDDSISDLFNNWGKNFAAGLAAPLLDGGRRRAEVRRVKALVAERFAAYREAAFTALGEVETAMSDEFYQKEYCERMRRQYAAAESAANEAFSRYTHGLETYFDALSLEVTRQNLEVNVVQAEYNLLLDRVRLYRVLGGDFSELLKHNEAQKN